MGIYLEKKHLHNSQLFVLFHKTAPSAAPNFVSASSVTSSSITIQWGAVDCIHHNGDITGYSVQYGVVGSENLHTLSVSGESVTEVTISGLKSSTNYSIRVAAVNSAGTGLYSDVIHSLTEGIYYITTSLYIK